MNDNLNELLSLLEDEIEKKSFELKQKRNRRIATKLFFSTCLLVAVIPCMLVFFGISFFILIIPAALFSLVSILLLTPLILDNNLGGLYNGETRCIN